MNREELIAYDRWLTENKWGSSEIITPEQAADLYLTEHPLPPAEGAEQRIRVRNILQDFYRRGEYELEQAEEDIMRLFQPQPTAEGAEAIVKKYEDEYDFKFHWVQRDRVIRMMREFAAQPQPKLDPKKVQWSGYGPLGNISQKPLQPTAEGAEANRASIDDLIKKHIPIDAANFEYCAKHNIINGGLLQGIRDVVNSFMKPQPTAEGAEEILKNRLGNQYSILSPLGIETIIAAMTEFATLHAQRIAEKMVSERISSIEALLDRAAGLVGNPGTNISVSCDVACCNWQRDYEEYLKNRDSHE